MKKPTSKRFSVNKTKIVWHIQNNVLYLHKFNLILTTMKTRKQLLEQVIGSINVDEMALCIVDDKKNTDVYFAGDECYLAGVLSDYIKNNINSKNKDVKELAEAILFGVAHAATTNEDVLDCFNDAVKAIEETEAEEEEDSFDPDDDECLSCPEYGNCLKKFVEKHKEMHADATKKEDSPEEDED